MKEKGHIIHLGDPSGDYLRCFLQPIKSFKAIQQVELFVWDESKIIDLIIKNFSEDTLLAYQSLSPYTYKADFARYCILYVLGGWYSDLGLTFIEKIPTTKNLILFYDFPAEQAYKILGIQTSLIYSKFPKNHFLKTVIEEFIVAVLEKRYGDNALDICGPVALYKILRDGKSVLRDNEVIYNFGNFGKKEENFYGDHPTFVYLTENGKVNVVFKDMPANNKRKETNDKNTNYHSCWNDLEVFK
jgi:hypothetical protein